MVTLHPSLAFNAVCVVGNPLTDGIVRVGIVVKSALMVVSVFLSLVLQDPPIFTSK